MHEENPMTNVAKVQTGLDDEHASGVGPFEIALVYEDADDMEGEHERPIGWVAIHADGQLEITEVDPDRERFLREVVGRVNGKPQISLISQEPPDEPAGPFATHTVSVSRDDPQFAEALRTYLYVYYGLRLV
jgi:hypothetical protein